MTAPIGATVTITYDADIGVTLWAGEYMRTPAGRCYRIVDRYRVNSSVAPNRWKVTALVIDKIPKRPGRRIHKLVFYPRGK